MSAPSTRHIEPLLPQATAAAASIIFNPRRLVHLLVRCMAVFIS